MGEFDQVTRTTKFVGCIRPFDGHKNAFKSCRVVLKVIRDFSCPDNTDFNYGLVAITGSSGDSKTLRFPLEEYETYTRQFTLISLAWAEVEIPNDDHLTLREVMVRLNCQALETWSAVAAL